MADKFCPFPDMSSCMHESCAWFIDETRECSIRRIGRTLTPLNYIRRLDQLEEALRKFGDECADEGIPLITAVENLHNATESKEG